MKNKTPEELAEEYTDQLQPVPIMHYLPTDPCRTAFLAGYNSRDGEVAKLKEEIEALKADLKEAR